ncbi:MAG: hypothetical protein ABR548_09905 [Actinomycetota bacterium]|nr:hypothetical protein [Actinomycetota bacterium]
MLRRHVALLIVLTALPRPAHAATPALLFANYTFDKTTQGWDGEGPAGRLGIGNADYNSQDKALQVDGLNNVFTATSPPLPVETTNIVWHFHVLGASYPTAIIAGARGANDEEIFTIAADGSTISVHDADGYEMFATGLGTSWHRLDFQLDAGLWRITYDESEVILATPASGAELSRLIVAPDSGDRIEIDDVRVYGPGTVIDNAYRPDSAAFPRTHETPLLGDSGTATSAGFRDPGYVRIAGSAVPGERTFVSWETAGLGTSFVAQAAFRHTSSPSLPDHVAVLAGLGEDFQPVWAITVAPVPLSPAELEYWFVDAGGQTTELGQPFSSQYWRQVRVAIDEAAQTLSGTTVNGPLVVRGSVPHTAYLASGDVFSGAGTPSPGDVPYLGPSGNNEMAFDDLVAAPVSATT